MSGGYHVPLLRRLSTSVIPTLPGCGLHATQAGTTTLATARDEVIWPRVKGRGHLRLLPPRLHLKSSAALDCLGSLLNTTVENMALKMQASLVGRCACGLAGPWSPGARLSMLKRSVATSLPCSALGSAWRLRVSPGQILHVYLCLCPLALQHSTHRRNQLFVLQVPACPAAPWLAVLWPRCASSTALGVPGVMAASFNQQHNPSC